MAEEVITRMYNVHIKTSVDICQYNTGAGDENQRREGT